MLTATVKERSGVVYEITLKGPEVGEASEALGFSLSLGPRTLREDLALPATPKSLYLLHEWAKKEGIEVKMTSRLSAWFRSEKLRLSAMSGDHIFEDEDLYDFQKYGVGWVRATSEYNEGKIRCLIADDPRLGKSVQALRSLDENHGRILILCLKSLIPQWVEYVRTWLPGDCPIAVLRRSRDERRERLDLAIDNYPNAVVIANWETVLMKIPRLFKTSWHAVIGDEAHRLKSRKSRTLHEVRRLKARHIMLLSGTFVEKTPIDWWGPLSVIHPKEFRSYWTFVSWYVKTYNNGFGTVLTGAKNSSLMRAHLSPYVLRRRAKDVSNLPAIIEEDISVELPKEHQDIYDKAKKEAILELQSGELDIPNQAARIVRLRQLTTHPALLDRDLWLTTPQGKYEVLKDLLNEVIPQDEQVLIYSTFVAGAVLAAHVTEGELYAGETSDPEAIARFQRGESRTLCATPGKGGVGLNLYNANYVIYIDRPWSSILWRQSRDRVVALDKKGSVLVYTLVSKNTIDEYVVKTLIKKMKIISESDVIKHVKSMLVS